MEPIPPDTVAVVRGATNQLVGGIIDLVRSENPVYAHVLGGPEGVGIQLGVEQAISSFLDAIERGERPTRETAEVWQRLGEAEFQAGRSLEALRAAWRSGTRAAWRGAAELAADAGVPTSLVIALAEAIFVFTDELATDVVEGYLRAQSDEAGERERRRRRLGSLLLEPEGHDPEAIAHASELARWPLPQRLAALALDTDTPGALTRRLSVDALVGSDSGGAFLLLPDPGAPGQAAMLKRALGTTVAALGPAVAPREAFRSLRWARCALELVGRGALPNERPTCVENHLATVILLQDETMARAMSSSRLAALEELPKPERERMLATLAAWLAHQRHTPGVAAALHVHPQTVRYRVAKLQELLGGTLESPDGRFELELALRARAGLP